MRILAFDLSLTSTGWACDDGTTGVLEPPKQCKDGVRRLQWIRSQVLDRIGVATRLVVIEGYAYAAMYQSHQIGELGGVIRLALHNAGVQWVAVPPTSLKKFATGNGNASKDAMLSAAIRKFGYTGDSNDEADAWLLVKMAQANYGGGSLTAPQRLALKAVPWPSFHKPPVTFEMLA